MVSLKELDKKLQPVAIFMVGFGIGFFLFYMLIGLKHPLSIGVVLNKHIYPIYSVYDQNDPVVLNITEYCMPFPTLSTKVECTVKQVRKFFNYTDGEHKNDITIRTPTETKEHGGVCRDYAILYDAIFRNMNIITDFIFTDNHVFNNIWTKEGYCTVDQITYDCHEFN